MAKKHEQKTETIVPDRNAQREMHKDFFDRCQCAIDNGFYFEAVLMEYAAIEARLEVILGMLGLPCNQYICNEDRQKISISHRVNCISRIRKNGNVFEKSKLPDNYFKKLKKWIDNRNGYIHGLYKNEIQYKNRMKDSKNRAEEGLELCRQLYNEANRIRRLIKKQDLNGEVGITCYEERCILCAEKMEK